MNRRTFLSTGIIGSTSLLGLSSLSGCSSLSKFAIAKPIVPEFRGKLNTAPMYWTNVMLYSARSLSLNPLNASRSFAMAHYAGYLAMTGDGLTMLTNASIPSGVNPELAYGVALSHALEDALDVSFAVERQNFVNQFDKTGLSESIAWAKSQAKRVIQLRTQDGAERAKARLYPEQYKKQHHSLSWSPTAPMYSAKNGPGFNAFDRGISPTWGAQKPWLLSSVTSYEAVAFPELGSSEFTQQYNRAKLLGDINNPERTQEHNQVSLFWEDGLMGVSVPGHFSIIAMQLLNQRAYNSTEQARLFALMSVAQADAGIIAWHNKYLHDIIRPETAIRFANTRFPQQQQLSQDSNWKSYIPTPAFPSYISGHSIFGAAACGVMSKFFASDNIDITSPAPDMVNWPNQLDGVRRRFTSFSQIADENGMSREYGGVHWQIDNTEGLRLGDELVNKVISPLVGS